MKIAVHAILACLSFTIGAEPYRPANESVVVARLPKSLIALQRSSRPQISETPIALAREYLQIAQHTSDPAFVRYAEELLSAIPGRTNPELLFLTAVVSQHKHEFDAAIQQLNEVRRLAPANKEAALLTASILTTQGRYDEAKRIFAKNLRLTSTLRGLTIALTIASLNGNLEKSELALERAINAGASTPEQAFAWCGLGEMAVRRGDPQIAESRFRKSLELEPADSYTLAAYCDLLLATGRGGEVVLKIESVSTSEALLTRRFLAMNASREQATAFVEQLKTSGHWRELAMLQLELLHDPEAALESASRNWDKQKEPMDALIILRSAAACKRPPVIEPVMTWLATTKMEDRRLDPFMRTTGPSVAAAPAILSAAVGNRPRSGGTTVSQP